MQHDGMEAGVAQHDFEHAAGRRVTAEDSIDLFPDGEKHPFPKPLSPEYRAHSAGKWGQPFQAAAGLLPGVGCAAKNAAFDFPATPPGRAAAGPETAPLLCFARCLLERQRYN
jgi:hypothetical protein